jgi:hypothetical protein
MNGSVTRQLQQAAAELRALVPEQTPEREAAERRWRDASRALSLTMSEDHIRRVNAELATRAAGRPPEDEGAARLAAVVRELLYAAEYGLTNFALSLPPVVAEVYLVEPDSHPFEQCRDCGLVLPLGIEYWRGTQHHPLEHWFERCPLCDGSIGRWDKWHGGPTLPTPAEKRAAFAGPRERKGKES